MDVKKCKKGNTLYIGPSKIWGKVQEIDMKKGSKNLGKEYSNIELTTNNPKEKKQILKLIKLINKKVEKIAGKKEYYIESCIKIDD